MPLTDPMLSISTFPPDELLKPYVSMYYSVSATRPEISQIIAASTRKTLSFQYGNPIRTSLGSAVRSMPEIAISGAITQPYLILPQDRQITMFIVEFTDIGLYCLAGSPTDQLTDVLVDALRVLPEATHPDMMNALHEISADDRRVDLLNQALLQIVPEPSVLDAIHPIMPGIRELHQTQGAVSIQDLVAGLNVSERHFRRQFREVTGLSAKAFAKVLRFNVALEMLWSIDDPAELFSAISDGAQAQYSDQAHFILEFNSYTGYSPGALPLERFRLFRALSQLDRQA